MRDEIEVMRVLRVPPLGKLVVAAGGSRIQSLENVRDDAVRRRLLAAIGELIVFAGGYEKLVETGAAPPLEAPPSQASDEEPPLTAEQEAFLSSLEEELKATVRQSGQVTEVSSAAELEARLQEMEAERNVVNLVEDIDHILQRYLADEPSLVGRTIHLEQPPNRPLRIRVDDRYYDHPRDIEDVTVRRVLRQALMEWEGR